jgi:formylglycine-generating enzyme required for sulfatase activity
MNRRIFAPGGCSSSACILAIGMLAFSLCPTQLTASPAITSIVPVPRLSVQSDVGITNQIQFLSALGASPWTAVTNLTVTASPYTVIDANSSWVSNGFYRVATSLGHITTITRLQFATKLTIESEVGITNQIQYTPNPLVFPWTTLTNLVVVQSPYWFVDDTLPPSSTRVYRVVTTQASLPPPTNMILVPAGSFQMGDNLDGMTDALPVHTVEVGAFYIDPTEVTKTIWDEVYQWAITNGYSFSSGVQGIASNHPVHSVTWHDAVKWCNARSEKEGRVPAYYTNPATTLVYRSGQVDLQNSWVLWAEGYRLPTEAEWEKAARGGATSHRFPWADTDTISQSRANYYSFWQNGQPFYSYDTGPTNGYHPMFSAGEMPHTSPAGFFGTNGFGLYDMAGNLWEWCWDWWSNTYYSSSPGTDPLGPTSGSYRILRGGSWATHASGCRTANRGNGTPDSSFNTVGFRTVLSWTGP